MKKFLSKGTIIKNTNLIPDMYQMDILSLEIAQIAKPGQFVHIRFKDSKNFLRRPFSIADCDKESGIITIYYRVIGKGTLEYSLLEINSSIDILGPIGTFFDTSNIFDNPLLIGGGVGIAPLIFLSKILMEKDPIILIGGKNKDEVFWKDLFLPYSKNINITTDDGSIGTKGFTTDLLPIILKNYPISKIFTCGPDIMMKQIAHIANTNQIPCQVSLEKRMACGFGVCLACTCENKIHNNRVKVCTDGPVFNSEEVYANES